MNKYEKEKAIDGVFLESAIAMNESNDAIQFCVTEEYDAANRIIYICKLIRSIIETKETLYAVRTNTQGQFQHIHATKSGREFLVLLESESSEIQRNYPRHKFNPLVDLYLKCIEDHQLSNYKTDMKPSTEMKLSALVNQLNGCIEAIRKEGQSHDFKVRCENNIRAAKKNAASLKTYVKKLREKYERLMAIRLDCSYLKAHSWPTSGADAVNVDEFRAHREAFIAALPKILPAKSLAGFIWKLEYGQKKGFHIHTVIFLKGSIAREDVTIGRLLGEYWKKNITQGKGLYFNCNHLKEDRYKGSCAIGMLTSDDAKWELFDEKVITYITKPDLHASLELSDRGRIFGRGKMPKLNPVKMGRPRSSFVKNLSSLLL